MPFLFHQLHGSLCRVAARTHHHRCLLLLSPLLGNSQKSVLQKITSHGHRHHLNQMNYYSDNRSDRGTFKQHSTIAMATQDQIFLVVGLGNHPYPETRHSIGMKTIDQLAKTLGLKWEKLAGRRGGSICQSVLAANNDHRSEVVLFKPKALMNVNGDNVAKTAKQLGVKADRIYLVHDELDLPVGKYGLKMGGSAKGHRGVLSCISSLKSSGLWPDESCTDTVILPRLRIGIGRPVSKSEVVSYVLDPFPREDMEAVSVAMDAGIDLLLRHLTSQLHREAEDPPINDKKS